MDTRTAITPWLRHGERVLWSGRPAQGLRVTARDIYLIPLSLVFLAMGAWPLIAPARPVNGAVPSNPFGYIPYMFLAVGLFLTVGRFLVDAWLRGRIAYAVTDGRVMMVHGWPFGGFKGVPIGEAAAHEVTLGSGRIGTIRFGKRSFLARRGLEAWIPSLEPLPQLLMIRNPTRVLDTILEASREADRRRVETQVGRQPAGERPLRKPATAAR